jgi:hypothetical protein
MVSGVSPSSGFLLRCNGDSLDISYLENAAIIQRNQPRVMKMEETKEKRRDKAAGTCSTGKTGYRDLPLQGLATAKNGSWLRRRHRR